MQGTTTLLIASDHPALPGHFPGQPIVPGVVLLDEAIHVIEEALQRQLDDYQIGTAKFLSPVGPGEQLQIRYEYKESGPIRFEIVSGERKVASGTLTLAGSGSSR